eukprot:gene12484-16746_t
MSCCPPDAEAYLQSSYTPIGGKITLGDGGYEIYVVGGITTKKAIVLIPDIWGWDSGRTRNLADFYSQQGYCVIVPKLLQPAFEGGTDGDGLPPDFDMPNRRPEFLQYLIANVTWEEVLKPRIVAIYDYLISNGCEKSALIGHCWGGWVTCRVLADPLFGQFFTCSAIAHPSVQFELQFGGSLLELADKMMKPVLLMPCQDGSFFITLKSKFPSSHSTNDQFRHVKHGFLPRGESSDPIVQEAINNAIGMIIEFINNHT